MDTCCSDFPCYFTDNASNPLSVSDTCLSSPWLKRYFAYILNNFPCKESQV